MRSGKTVRSRGSWRQRRPSILDSPWQAKGWGCPLPQMALPLLPWPRGGGGIQRHGNESRPLASSRLAVPDLPHPSTSPRVRRGVSVGLGESGLTLTVPSCPSGPAAACDTAASSSSWARAGGCGVTGGGKGARARQPPAQPACARSAALAPDGWAALSASWASRAPAAARSLLLRARLRPRPPGHSFLQVCFLVRPRLPGAPQAPGRSPGRSRRRPPGRPQVVWRPRPPVPPRPTRVAGSR